MTDATVLTTIIIAITAIAGLAYFIIKSATSHNRIETAIKWIKANDFNKAMEILKSIISKDDTSSDAHFYLAECYFQTNNYEWALPEYKRVIKFNKYDNDNDNTYNEALVRRRLADVYLHFNQLEEAQKEFLLIIKLDPNNYKSYFGIGKIYVDRKHFDKALQYFQKSIKLSPSHLESLFYSGKIKYEMKRYNEALIDLEKCVSQDKYFYKANFYIGMANCKVKNLTKALEQLDLASRDREYRLESLYQKGLILFELNETDQATIEFEKVVSGVSEENEMTLDSRYHLASCHEMVKDINSAIEQWEKISDFNPDFKDVASKLANYADLRMEDTLKDFFVAPNDAFKNMCIEALKKLNIEVKETLSCSGVSAEFIGFERLGTKDIRTQRTYIRVYRDNQPIGDNKVRDIVERAKKEVSGTRALCISATGFSKTAIEFAETRPINLVSGKEFSKCL